jgi:hypothetical protein
MIASDDTFFYPFIGAVIFVGVIGLIWPTLIIIDRIRRKKRV